MITLSMSEIIDKTCKLKTKDEKVEWLKKHNTLALRDVLALMFNKDLEFTIPNTAPPYEPSEYPDSQGQLFHEARKLKYFVKGFGGNLPQVRKEQLFIQMLESVDKEDAKLLIKMLQKKPPKGLTVAVVNEAFGNIIPTKSSKNGKVEE